MHASKKFRMPAAFIGHGSPMNALENNRYTDAWRRFAASIPTPKAILVVSAHWYTRGVGVTAMPMPRTIHDFGGFPKALFDMHYPAPGEPALATQVCELLKPVDVRLEHSWGLDHGAWSILVHMFSEATVPVIQLSIDGTQPAKFHYELGKQLDPLRDEGVLIVGSGNVVHNLGLAQRSENAAAYDWADLFNKEILTHLQTGNHIPLIEYESFGSPAQLSIPTPEHYLPMLYILGLQRNEDSLTVLVDGLELASISMLSFAIGA